ncbi:MAG TPA: DUF2127 domain-containing protein [Sphingomicrobium sp.]|nr:DUF2127 domain-containing protein [Sphingomicrobium sp.]
MSPVATARNEFLERRIHAIFQISVALKGLHALIEIAAGFALYLLSRDWIVATLNRAAEYELIEDPNDYLARHIHGFTQSLSISTQHFYAFYLLSHGLVKAVLVIGLLREKLWAYPASFVVLSLFIVYQMSRFVHTHEIGLIGLTILDFIVIALAWHEYRLLREHLPTH